MRPEPGEVRQASDSAGAEVADQLLGVVVLPTLVRAALGVLLVRPHQQPGQLAADHLAAEQLRQLRQGDQPLGIPGRPVVIGPVADPEDPVVGLAASWSRSATLV
jgi:hypothetical protein